MKKILNSLSGLFFILGVFCNTALADNKTIPIPTASPAIITPKVIPHYAIKIISPKPNETFQNSAQSITMTVAVTPELEPEDKIIVFVDGNPVGEPTYSTSLDLPWLARGSHTLHAKIIQPKGRGAETETITIFQQRKSKLLP